MTWREIDRKYSSEDREDMSFERECEFVKDCFAAYEAAGFADTFSATYGGAFGSRDEECDGKKFIVVRRVPRLDEDKENGADLECLPMWRIRFKDGTEMDTFPAEICLSEREVL